MRAVDLDQARASESPVEPRLLIHSSRRQDSATGLPAGLAPGTYRLLVANKFAPVGVGETELFVDAMAVAVGPGAYYVP
ncbi:MAG: hypothetical protein GC160_28225 [Acidobacteria bacterium]|nr:hypothetical protein [Acidobacteriota bacterium]